MQDIPIGNSGNDINNSHIITASNWVGHGGQHFCTSPPHNLVFGSPRCLTILSQSRRSFPNALWLKSYCQGNPPTFHSGCQRKNWFKTGTYSLRPRFGGWNRFRHRLTC